MKTLWTIPVPSSADLEPELRLLPGRVCDLSFFLDVDHSVRGGLVFEGVIAYRCSFLDALTTEMITSAYNKLVDMESSEWLTAGRATNCRTPGELRHLRILFDDGPCYEFLCTGFRLK